MEIKKPCAIDLYGRNTFPDLSQYDPLVIAFLKASEGDFTDYAFVERMSALKFSNVRRGCYHFYRKSVNIQTQIDTFVHICQNAGVTPDDVLVGDFEEEGQTEAMLRNWLEGVKAKYPNNLILIYSRRLLLDAIATTSDYFKQYPVWIAGYPNDPDAFPSPPPAYIPDQSRWGAVWCWQYANTSIGVNWVSSEFLAWLGQSSDPPPAQDFNEWIFKLKPENIVRASVTGYPSNRTVAQAAQEFHATCQAGNHSLVINGDGWRSSGIPNGDWVVNGIWKHAQPKDSYSPRITFNNGNNGQMCAIAGARGEYWYPEKVGDYNAFGLTRRLVMNGAINPAFHDTGELNARTTFGFTPDGTLVIQVNDGWDRNSVTGAAPKGRTIKQTGEILIANGCIEAGDGDGGGSVTLAIDGKVINDYNDDGVKVMRAVVNHLYLELNIDPLSGIAPQPPPDNGGSMKITVLQKVRERKQPNFYADGIGDALTGETFSTDVSSPDTNPAGPNPVTWYELELGKWAPDRHHTDPAIFYLNIETVTPPPVDPNVTHVINVYDDGKISVDNGEPF